ncbi:L-serine ammonia-lyase, iron-sulfur-dependent, subunit alpha, partial [Intestinimonas massiliensis]
GWSSGKETKELKSSLDTIRKTAAEMIEGIDAKLKVLLADGGSPEQMAAACATALQNLMGLVCYPVAGLVELPCVGRNVIGAMNALSAAELALAGAA